MPTYPKVFSYEHTRRMPVAYAVRTFMSILLFFSAVKREHKLTYFKWYDDPKNEVVNRPGE